MVTKRIPLTQGMFALVDDDDFANVASYSWSIKPDRWNVYASSWVDGRTVTMHRLIMGARKGEVIDHVNGLGLDNRRANLRSAGSTGNARNARRRKDNTSGFKGVCYDPKRNCYIVGIGVNGRRRHVGRFVDVVDAARAYDSAARRLHGDYARTNF